MSEQPLAKYLLNIKVIHMSITEQKINFEFLSNESDIKQQCISHLNLNNLLKKLNDFLV